MLPLNIQLDPLLEFKLREQAKLTGKPVEQLVKEAIETTLRAASQSNPRLSAEQKQESWRSWASKRTARKDLKADDTGESIYSGRGE